MMRAPAVKFAGGAGDVWLTRDSGQTLTRLHPSDPYRPGRIYEERRRRDDVRLRYR